MNPPSPPKSHWFFGDLRQFRDTIPYLTQKKQEMGAIFRVPLPFGKKLFSVNDPDLIKYVLQDNNKNYSKGMAYDNLRPLLGNGLLTNEGDFWRQQRRLAQPAFHKERLRNMTQTIVECVEEMKEKWMRKYTSGDLINISEEMNHLALAIVSRTLFRSEISSKMGDIGTHLFVLMEGVAKDMRQPLLSKIIPPSKARKEALQSLLKLIEDIIEARRQDPQEHHDLLAMLMGVRDEDSGQGMSDAQLRDEVMTLFMAGHETTANALTYALLALANNPSVDQKLKSELDENPSPSEADFGFFKSLEYLNKVIQETLRLYPPAWAISRCSIEKDRLGDYDIPARANLLMSPYLMQRDETFWEKPDVFQPERFDNQKLKKMPRYAYFPFGGGPRLCIGDQFALLEMSIALSILRRHFRFGPRPEYQLEVMPMITLKPKEAIQLDLLMEK